LVIDKIFIKSEKPCNIPSHLALRLKKKGIRIMEGRSETASAIIAFSQSEKIKAGLIWLSNASSMIDQLPGPERQGAARFLGNMMGMLHREVMMAGSVTGHPEWEKVSSHLERAMVMIDSGAAEGSLEHLTQALSQVTNIAQSSMGYLKEKNLL